MNCTNNVILWNGWQKKHLIHRIRANFPCWVTVCTILARQIRIHKHQPTSAPSGSKLIGSTVKRYLRTNYWLFFGMPNVSLFKFIVAVQANLRYQSDTIFVDYHSVVELICDMLTPQAQLPSNVSPASLTATALKYPNVCQIWNFKCECVCRKKVMEYLILLSDLSYECHILMLDVDRVNL